MSQQNGLYEYFRDKENGQLTLAQYVRPFVAEGHEVTISGNGTSMRPSIDSTCQLVMERASIDCIRAGDVLLYERNDGHSVIHRVWSKKENCLCMVGDNQFVVEREAPFSAVVARVKTIKREDGTERDGHQGVFRMRVRFCKKRLWVYCRILGHLAKTVVKKILGKK